MNQAFDATTIIFALLAIFVIWKLRSVLGTRVEIEKKPDQAESWRGANRDAAASAVPGGPTPAPVSPGPAASAAVVEPPPVDAARGLEAIRQADPRFDAGAFLAGAQTAYAMIVEAFAKGDRLTLNNLLGDDALRAFTAALDAGPVPERRVVKIEHAGVTAASLSGSLASVTVRFRALIAEGPPAAAAQGAAASERQMIEANDLWTFARDTRSPNPNWKLVATATDEHAG